MCGQLWSEKSLNVHSNQTLSRRLLVQPNRHHISTVHTALILSGLVLQFGLYYGPKCVTPQARYHRPVKGQQEDSGRGGRGAEGIIACLQWSALFRKLTLQNPLMNLVYTHTGSSMGSCPFCQVQTPYTHTNIHSGQCGETRLWLHQQHCALLCRLCAEYCMTVGDLCKHTTPCHSCLCCCYHSYHLCHKRFSAP